MGVDQDRAVHTQTHETGAENFTLQTGSVANRKDLYVIVTRVCLKFRV